MCLKGRALTPEQREALYRIYNKSSQNATNRTISENPSFQDIEQDAINAMGTTYFDTSTSIAVTILFALLIIFGTALNGFVVSIVIRNKKLHSQVNAFIVNLAISDMVMCLVCVPFSLVRLTLKDWVFGEALCKVIPTLQCIIVFASTISITSIALDRFYVIVRNRTHKQRQKCRFNTKALLITIWLVSITVSLPIMIYQNEVNHIILEGIEMKSRYVCIETWPNDSYKVVYCVVVLVLQLFLPAITLSTLHWRICRFLKRRISSPSDTTIDALPRSMTSSAIRRGGTNTQRRYYKNARLLVTIIVMFALVWFPMTFLNLLVDFKQELFFYNKTFSLSYAIVLWVAMVSACINPLLYGWFNSNFRTEFLTS
ncbi:unnamed protein product, partial [Owenia fusiformis]